MTYPHALPGNEAPRGVSSRDRLLGAAKTLFATNGYEQTTTAAIARMAKTSESQLTKHFENKQGVLRAIFATTWEAINKAAREGIKNKNADAKLGVLLQVIITTFDRDPELRLLLLMEGRRLRVGHRIEITEGFLGFVGLLDDVLRELQDSGMLIPTLHPQAVRSALMGAVEGLLRDRTLAEIAGYPAQFAGNDVSAVFELLIGSFSNRNSG
jgi:AcrR family transcriptional regulator